LISFCQQGNIGLSRSRHRDDWDAKRRGWVPLTTVSMNQEWDSYQQWGQQAEAAQNLPYAEAMWAMAVIISQQFGNADQRVAYSLDSLGRTLVRQHKFSLAENILGRSWAIKTQVSKVGPVEQARTLDLVGEMYFRQGRLDEARGICQRVLEMYQASFPMDNPLVQTALSNLAMVDSARLRAMPAAPPPPPQTVAAAAHSPGVTSTASVQSLTAPQAVQQAPVQQQQPAVAQPQAVVNSPATTGRRRSAMPTCEVCGAVMDADWCYRCTGNSVKAISPENKLGR
jgi:tetratricopeptide (TPR) repeat protein